MAISKSYVWLVLLITLLCDKFEAKLSEDALGAGNKIERDTPIPAEVRGPKKIVSDGGGAALLFADELKITLERYLFGICPQTFKIQLGRSKNATISCDLDTEQQDLAGRFATLALRAHSAARSDCSRLGAALANTLGELARTAASRNLSTAEANKKRKLSKAAKAKLQAKQRTALAVKKKAAAAAAKTAAAAAS